MKFDPMTNPLPSKVKEILDDEIFKAAINDGDFRAAREVAFDTITESGIKEKDKIRILDNIDTIEATGADVTELLKYLYNSYLKYIGLGVIRSERRKKMKKENFKMKKETSKKIAEMSTEEVKEFEEKIIESLEDKISKMKSSLQKDNIITVQQQLISLSDIAKDAADKIKEEGSIGVKASKKAEQLSREEYDIMKDAVDNIVLNFEKITGTNPVDVIDPEGQFYSEVIEETFPLIKEYALDKYSEINDKKLWEEFLYKLDNQFMENYADKARQGIETLKKTQVRGGVNKMKKETAIPQQTFFRAYPPKTDIERVMTHYDVSEEDAKMMMETTPIEELLPERGTRLKEVSKKTAQLGVGFGVGMAMGLAKEEEKRKEKEKVEIGFVDPSKEKKEEEKEEGIRFAQDSLISESFKSHLVKALVKDFIKVASEEELQKVKAAKTTLELFASLKEAIKGDPTEYLSHVWNLHKIEQASRGDILEKFPPKVAQDDVPPMGWTTNVKEEEGKSEEEKEEGRGELGEINLPELPPMPDFEVTEFEEGKVSPIEIRIDPTQKQIDVDFNAETETPEETKAETATDGEKKESLDEIESPTSF